ncbi:MAG: MFS transporter [Acidobacteria bacterium]|nr:MAG: MFS transporter [Acidobacteriota bacterium]
MDSFIFALVLTPAVTELLPRSGIAASPSNVGFYGSVLFALFLLGWGLSMAWGPIADRYGRVRTLAMTILCYSLFTFLCALVTDIWQLAACRILAGVGIGGEWSTGYYFGFFLAALANYFIGATFGWRAMFVLGGTPALLVSFIRRSVHESERFERKHSTAMRAAFLALFSPTYARRTVLNSLFLLVSIVGLWAGSVYVPTSVTQLATRAGYSTADGARLASYGTMLLSVGTILGCIALPYLADRFGRRMTLGFYFLVMFLSISIGFGYVFYLTEGALAWFFPVLFLLGVGGANFAMYTLWLPEQYSTDCRASAFAFTTSVGRFIGAGITFLVGAGVAFFGTLGTPVALTSLAFLVGLLLVPFGEETTGKPLPA